MIEPSSVDCVIYHADCTDGFGAAYSAWKLLGNRAEYHACKHGTPPPPVKGKNVVILDFAFNNSTTKKMIEDAQKQTKSKQSQQGRTPQHCVLKSHTANANTGRRSRLQ